MHTSGHRPAYIGQYKGWRPAAPARSLVLYCFSLSTSTSILRTELPVVRIHMQLTYCTCDSMCQML